MSILASYLGSAPASLLFKVHCNGAALASGSPSAAGTWEALKGWAQFAALLALGLGVAAALGVFKLRQADGPVRLPADRSPLPLLWGLCVAVLVWFGVQLFYVAAVGGIRAAAGHPLGTTQPMQFELSPGDYAFIAIVPDLLGLAVMLAVDRVLMGSVGLRLGFFNGGFLKPVGRGLLGALSIVPLVLVCGSILELIYQAVHFQHPTEHALLLKMSETNSPAIRFALIVAAVAVAPVAEEYFFRGFLQTLLRRSFIAIAAWRREPRGYGFPMTTLTPAPGLTPAPASAGGAAPLSVPPAPDLAPAGERHGPGRHAWATWAAILLTAFIFAINHELWSAPIIFVLAIGLGYAYERTGSLWTSITIHVAFNAFMTAWSLRSGGG